MQNTTFRYTPKSPPSGNVSVETPPQASSLTPPGYFARVAFAAGICTLTALTAIAILALRAGLPIHPFDLAMIVIALSALAGGVIGGYWTIRHIERPIRLEDRALHAENEKMRIELAEMETRLAKPADYTGHNALIAAWKLAGMHLAGLETSKAKSGLDPKDHAAAFVILRAIGLITGERKATTWTTDEPAEVIAALLTLTKTEPDRTGRPRIWISTSNGQRSVYLNGEDA